MSAANSQELEERTGWIFPPQLSKGNNRFKVTSENLLNSFPARSPQHCETITFCYFSCSPRGPLLKRVYWINTWDWTTEGNGLSQGSSKQPLSGVSGAWPEWISTLGKKSDQRRMQVVRRHFLGWMIPERKGGWLIWINYKAQLSWKLTTLILTSVREMLEGNLLLFFDLKNRYQE